MQDRAAILALHARSMPLDEGVDLAQMAADCRGFTGADLAALCREAAMHALSAADAAGEDNMYCPFPSCPLLTPSQARPPLKVHCSTRARLCQATPMPKLLPGDAIEC